MAGSEQGSEQRVALSQALGELPSWQLDDLYTSVTSNVLFSDLEKAASDAASFEYKWRGKLAEAATKSGDEGIGTAIREFETLEDLIGRIASFAGLTYFSDTSKPENGKLYGDVQSKIADMSAYLLFFSEELRRIDDAILDGALENDALAAHYKPWLTDLRMDKPYRLDDKLEQLFFEKSITGAAAFNRLFDETLASLSFNVDGETLPLEVTRNRLQDPATEVRKKAAMALAETLSANIRTFTLITNTLAKDKEISDRWRGYQDIADSRHLANRIEREVVDALVEAVRSAYPRLSHRYYTMKAKWLGMEQMDFWDRSAPLPEPTSQISWLECKEIVLSAYHDFSPKMAEIAERFFDESWIDAPVRPGKAPGAFAHPTVPSAHPYVLVNYMGKPRDVMTLAHELGHGVHQVLAGGQGALMAPTPLMLAETASLFGEMLTFRALLDRTKDKRERKAMLSQKVEDMINTVVRQIAFYEFERKVHTARKEGELTADDIGKLWLSVQSESLGPAIRISEGYETYWAYIPHFIHSPFYVYAYAFGDCFVNSLYAVYRNAEKGFQEKYIDLLKAGGTKHHSELLAPFGLDATDPSFWAQGLSTIEGLFDELDAMDHPSRLDVVAETIRTTFDNNLAAQNAIGLLQFFEKRMEFLPIRLITIPEAQRALGLDTVTKELMAALGILCSIEPPYLKPEFRFRDETGTYSLSKEDFARTKDGEVFIHPMNGRPVPDLEKHLFMCFRRVGVAL